MYLLASPSVYQHPQTTVIIVNESLDITCSFKAKPAANISWFHEGSGIPDITVLNITTSESNNKPYIITTSNMSWKTKDEDKRISVSGNYTCNSANSLGHTMSEMVEVNIHCKFLSNQSITF